MRTLTLLLALTGALATAEKPETKPAVKTPEPPKVAALTELQQVRLEKIQAQMQVLRLQEQTLNAEASGVIAGACRPLGGLTADDCILLPPSQGQAVSVQLRPKAAPPASKPEPEKGSK
jgi:hypothetical protein